MNILRPLLAGIATGIGMRFGSDLYDKMKAKAPEGGSLKGFNPFSSNEEAEAEAETAQTS